METITIYKCYQVCGYNEVFFWHPITNPGFWDKVTVQLPEGAKMTKTEAGGPAVELKNGHLCTHIFTDWQKDCVVPYLIDTDSTNPRQTHRILLDVIEEGDVHEMD